MRSPDNFSTPSQRTGILCFGTNHRIDGGCASNCKLSPFDSFARNQKALYRFLKSYGSALSQGKAYWIENETAQGLIRDLLEGLQSRKRAGFIRTRTVAQG